MRNLYNFLIFWLTLSAYLFFFFCGYFLVDKIIVKKYMIRTHVRMNYSYTEDLLRVFSEIDLYSFEVVGDHLENMDILIQPVLGWCSSWPYLSSLWFICYALLQYVDVILLLPHTHTHKDFFLTEPHRQNYFTRKSTLAMVETRAPID